MLIWVTFTVNLLNSSKTINSAYSRFDTRYGLRRTASQARKRYVVRRSSLHGQEKAPWKEVASRRILFSSSFQSNQTELKICTSREQKKYFNKGKIKNVSKEI
jgi:hypothetical protein